MLASGTAEGRRALLGCRLSAKIPPPDCQLPGSLSPCCRETHRPFPGEVAAWQAAIPHRPHRGCQSTLTRGCPETHSVEKVEHRDRARVYIKTKISEEPTETFQSAYMSYFRMLKLCKKIESNGIIKYLKCWFEFIYMFIELCTTHQAEL